MILAKLTISQVDLGITTNRAEDVGLASTPTTTSDGKGLVRGLGTHFVSQEAKERFVKLQKDSNLVREKFNRRFGKGPFDSTYIVDLAGLGIAFGQDVAKEIGNPDIKVYVTEWDLGARASAPEELVEWTDRLKKQMMRVPIGTKKIKDEGLAALESIAKCPLLTQATREKLLSYINAAKFGGMTRVELTRNIELLEVKMDEEVVIPRRTLPSEE